MKRLRQLLARWLGREKPSAIQPLLRKHGKRASVKDQEAEKWLTALAHTDAALLDIYANLHEILATTGILATVPEPTADNYLHWTRDQLFAKLHNTPDEETKAIIIRRYTTAKIYFALGWH